MIAHRSRLWQCGIPYEAVRPWLACRVASHTRYLRPSHLRSTRHPHHDRRQVDLLYTHGHMAPLCVELSTLIDKDPWNTLATELWREIGRMDMIAGTAALWGARSTGSRT